MKVSVRGGFSDRNAIKPENKEIQLTSFDKRTRIQFQNMISELYSEVYKEKKYEGSNIIQGFLRYVISEIFSEPINPLETYYCDNVFLEINSVIESGDYDDVLTIIEALVRYWDDYLKDALGDWYYNDYFGYRHQSIFQKVNTVFEREYVGYRFIDGLISPISDEYEVESIEDALESPYESVRNHLSKANLLLSDRNSPDYENSIKESISAIEAICEIKTGCKGSSATLRHMLKELETNGVKIHGSLKSAFEKLYGYTSDANGIRHAGDIGGPSSTFEEAKFMLVACSAFINYLVALSAD